MVKLIKHEWHSVDSQFKFELDEEKLSEIYPDLNEEEIESLLTKIQSGEADIEEVMDKAYEDGVEIYWEHDYDDWYTDRKGGYDITYEIEE